jgi:UDP:flavonoid glycosyltransferase YjiC (YdhE family)
MLRAALEALADEPVRIIATTNRHRPIERIDVPDNAKLEVWLPYSKVMPHADAVVTHGGHGTVARALDSGVPMVVCPAVGDMAENGARVVWSGTGVMVPRRLVKPRNIRLAVRRVLEDPRFRERAEEVAAWSRGNDGAARGAEAIEEYAAGRLSPARA